MGFGVSEPATAYDINALILKDLKQDGTHLDLKNSGSLMYKGAKRLAGYRAVRDLKVLILRQHLIGDPGAVALAASPFLKQLTVLDLFGNHIGPEGVRAMASSPLF
jgi:hypothetical protein